MGHRRIAYAYETSNDNNQNMVFSAEARLHGLMETAEKRKMTVERIAIRNYEDATNTILNSLLTMDPAPTALYCESDELALPVRARRPSRALGHRIRRRTTCRKDRPDHVASGSVQHG